MPITRDAAVWAYRMILGREPESDAVIDRLTSQPNIESLRQAFFNSDEFRQSSPIVPVGMHLGVAADPIKIDCTPDQHQKMFDRIAIAWRKFGEHEPYWSVLTADQFRQDEIGESMEAFYESGEPVVDELCALLGRNAIDPRSLSRVLDFGCGVGRLSLALAGRFAHITGVDISSAHLQLAFNRAIHLGIANVAFTVLNDIDSVEKLPACDLLFSRIVLQHNPPPVMIALLARLFDRIVQGGYAVFQVPTFIQGFSFDPESYLGTNQAQMEMNALPQRHIFSLAAQMGFMPIEVRENLDAASPKLVSQIFLFRRG